MVLFFSLTKLLPIAGDVLILAAVMRNWAPAPADSALTSREDSP